VRSQLAVNLVALEVHGRAVFAFGADLDARRHGKILKDPSGLAACCRDRCAP
jgi:hypothetical protein